MTTPERVVDPRPACFAVELDGGRIITCPLYPQPAEWAAVLVDGTETHRAAADNVGAAPVTELTRLAGALCPGRAATPDLPVPDDVESHGEECAVRAQDGGNTLRFAAAPAEVDYLRVCDPAGAEIAYWICDEFAEDAADVLGAVIGCLASTEGRR
jgi:hypothetical protein